ncbi:MAG: hypothetical protein U0X93_12570 [Anaerolineales bacterium]
MAGNYHVVRDLIWTKAEAIIWLDYPFLLVLRQLTRRTFTRWWTQELLWVQTTNRFGFTSNFGRKTRCSIGCSKRIGAGSARRRSYCLCQNIGIWN